MLNKNQSNKRNSWKYLLVAPALVAFVLLFQIEVVAQEKTSDFTVESGIDKVVLDVNSSSTEKKLNDEANFFKEEFDLDLNFSGIKLNNDNEITAIKVVLKNGLGIKKVYVVEENNPIKPFAVFAEKEKSGAINFGFQANAKDNRHLSQTFDHVKRVQNASTEEQRRDVVVSKVASDKSWSLNSFSKDGKEYLIILNGKKQVKGTPLKLSFNEDFDTQKILDPEEARLKYGEYGKDGVWEITTKKIKKSERVVEKINGKKPLLIINGNIAENQSNTDDIDPETIESVNVLKGKEATLKYGKAGKNGVMEITTKENKEGWGISFGVSTSKDDPKQITKDNFADYKNAIIIINGKTSDFETLQKIKPEDIISVGVSKPSKESESVRQIATKKHGEKALNGIINVETKK
jgi:hypothetical protein